MKLKKGSKAAREFMAKIRAKRKTKSIKRRSNSIKLSKKEVKMARRKSRRYGKARRSSSKSVSPMGLLVGGLIYGAGRNYASNLVAPLTSKLPFGNLADNAVLGGIAYFVSKKSSGVVKQIAQSALVVEAAMAGSDFAAGNTTVATESGYVFA